MIISTPRGVLTSYVPGQQYDMAVLFANNTRVNNGFELTAIGANGVHGTIAITDAANTQISSQSGRQYLKHTRAGQANRQSWDFKWTAPAAGSGTITFYACGNATNGNGSSSGDQIYTTSLVVPEGPATAVAPSAIEGGSLAAFPNPAADFTNVSFSLKRPANASLALYNLEGNKVHYSDLGFIDAAKQSVRFEIPANVAAGIYILRLEADGKASAIRMNVL